MAGSKATGLKAAKTNKKRYGRDYYKVLGAKGGLAKGPKGFALNDKASEAGEKGGSVSRRTWTLEQRAFQAEVMRETQRRRWGKKDLLNYETTDAPFWDEPKITWLDKLRRWL